MLFDLHLGYFKTFGLTANENLLKKLRRTFSKIGKVLL